MIDIGYLLMAENTQCFSNWLFVKETDFRDVTCVVDVKAKQKQEYPFTLLAAFLNHPLQICS